jgi:hypothetical protein
MNTLRTLAWLALGMLSTLSVGATESVELDYRLRPERDLVAEQVEETVTTMRVVTDRGLVARTAAQGARFPLTYHVVNRQRTRYVTGPAQPDGSFPATLSVLSRQSSLRLPSGEEQPLPGQPRLEGFEFKAVIGPQGQVLQPTLQAQGADAAALEMVRQMMAGMLEQLIRIEVITVGPGAATPQVVSMKLPLPGLGALDLKINGSNRLLEVRDGQAHVEMVYVLEFGNPEGPMKIEASGTGGGSLVYDIAQRVARRMETNTLMNVIAHVPDGTLEFQMNTRQTQQLQDGGR